MEGGQKVFALILEQPVTPRMNTDMFCLNLFDESLSFIRHFIWQYIKEAVVGWQ